MINNTSLLIHTNALRSKIPSSTGCVQSIWYLTALAFFLAPLFVDVDFLVTFVDVLAKDDVDLVLGVVAFGLAWTWAWACVDGTVAAAGFLVKSAFYLDLR